MKNKIWNIRNDDKVGFCNDAVVGIPKRDSNKLEIFGF